MNCWKSSKGNPFSTSLIDLAILPIPSLPFAAWKRFLVFFFVLITKHDFTTTLAALRETSRRRCATTFVKTNEFGAIWSAIFSPRMLMGRDIVAWERFRSRCHKDSLSYALQNMFKPVSNRNNNNLDPRYITSTILVFLFYFHCW